MSNTQNKATRLFELLFLYLFPLLFIINKDWYICQNARLLYFCSVGDKPAYESASSLTNDTQSSRAYVKLSRCLQVCKLFLNFAAEVLGDAYPYFRDIERY